MLVGDDVPNAAVAALDQGAGAPLPGLPRLRVAVAGEAESGPISLGRLVRPYLTHEVVIGQLAPGLLLGTGGDALSRLRDGDGASVRVPETFEQHPRPRAGWWPRCGRRRRVPHIDQTGVMLLAEHARHQLHPAT
jgi:hypothetical protein